MRFLDLQLYEPRDRLRSMILSTPTFYAFLNRADISLAFNVLWKEIPEDAASKSFTIISIFDSVSSVFPRYVLLCKSVVEAL